MNDWEEPVYKTLAASELGVGHTSGIVPTRDTQEYFGRPKEENTHTIKEIAIEFFGGEDVENIKTNVMYYVSSTHKHIHLTGNLMPTYLKYGAEPGDILVFWRNKTDDTRFKTELIKPGSERWDKIEASDDFPQKGGYLKLNPPLRKKSVSVGGWMLRRIF